jgi:anti-sigma factor ChrR (cupin superfamily)
LNDVTQESPHELAGLYALGALPPSERDAFEVHLAGCSECVKDVAAAGHLAAALAPTVPAPPELRQRVQDLADAPRGPVDVGAYTWDEVLPGVHMHTVKEEPERGVRKVLVWARPGARYPSHRHLGDEEILVLQGALRDRRGVYGPGQICRSATGSVHSEEVHGSEDCVCFVVYHGGHEPVAE